MGKKSRSMTSPSKPHSSDVVSWCSAEKGKLRCKNCGETRQIRLNESLPWDWFQEHSKCQAQNAHGADK